MLHSLNKHKKSEIVTRYYLEEWLAGFCFDFNEFILLFKKEKEKKRGISVPYVVLP